MRVCVSVSISGHNLLVMTRIAREVRFEQDAIEQDTRVCQVVCVKEQNLVRESISEFNREAIESRVPIADGHRPLFGNIGDRQVDHLESRLISWEHAMIFSDLADGHIHRLDRIGSVDGLTNLRGIGKEGNNPLPMGEPGFADGWMTTGSSVPNYFKSFPILHNSPSNRRRKLSNSGSSVGSGSAGSLLGSSVVQSVSVRFVSGGTNSRRSMSV